MEPRLKSNTQEMTPRVHQWISERGVDLKFSANKSLKGHVIPEFDCVFYLSKRKISIRGLAFIIQADMFDAGFNYTAAQILAVLTKFSFDHYIETQEYPEWLDNAGALNVHKRPKGRPRTHPRQVRINT